MKPIRLLHLLPLALFSACRPSIDPPLPHPGEADFSRVVVLGGSAEAGMRDGALSRSSQEQAFPALIHRQMVLAGAAELRLPLMPEGSGIGLNSKPWEYLYNTPARMGNRTDCEGVVSLGPVRDSISAAAAAPYFAPVSGSAWSSYAVPGASLSDMLSAGFSTSHPFSARFTDGTSPLAQARSVQPTFFLWWPGMQDLFNWAAGGFYTLPEPDPAVFAARLDSALAALTAGGAKGMIATLPDIRHIPFFTTVPSRAVELSAGQADSLNDFYALGGLNVGFVEGTNGFILSDPGTPGGLRQMRSSELLTLTAPLDSMKCYYYGLLVNLMHDRYALDSAELARYDQIRTEMNGHITRLAGQHKLALADLSSYFATVQEGIIVDAMEFNAAFASGGFFSLDGFTPTGKGAGLIANQCIQAINQTYKAAVPTVRIDDLPGVYFP